LAALDDDTVGWLKKKRTENMMTKSAKTKKKIYEPLYSSSNCVKIYVYVLYCIIV